MALKISPSALPCLSIIISNCLGISVCDNDACVGEHDVVVLRDGNFGTLPKVEKGEVGDQSSLVSKKDLRHLLEGR